MVQDRSGHPRLPVYDTLDRVDEVGFDDFVDRSRSDLFYDWPYGQRAAVLPGTTALSNAVKTERRQLPRSVSRRRERSGSYHRGRPTPFNQLIVLGDPIQRSIYLYIGS